MQSGVQFGVPDINQFMIDRGPPAQAGLLALSSDIILPRQHQESLPIKPRLNMHPHYIPFPLNHHYQQQQQQQQQQTMQQRLMGRGDDSSDNQSSSFAIQQQREEDEEVEDEDEDKRGQEWSAEESLALVRIRCEMELKFHDSTLQAFLWEDVSRKFGELGYQRGAEECRKNFEKLKKICENGKRWREYTELEAVHGGGNSINNSGRCTNDGKTNTPCVDTAATGEEASETVALERKNKKKRKRRHLATIRSFFEKLVKQLMQNQEALHSKFLEAIERRDQERLVREEAWKRQEMARLTRETELRAQEQALASTREAAIVAFLQKITGENLKLPETSTSSYIQTLLQEELTFMDREFSDVNGKRWPKPEVQTLIRLRSNLEPKFQEPGPKGLLWQEISAGMTALGFTNRSAKRCKEKWENINKYFRKTKGSIKKRPENAKTCPYFHQLDALYRKGILSSPSKSTRTDEIHNCSEALVVDDSGQCNQKANGNHIQGHSENVISVAEEIVPPNNSDNIYFFRSPDPLVHCQNTVKAKNILSENVCVTSKFMTPNVEACVRGNPSGDAFSESSGKSEKMERLVKEMMEVQQQQQQQQHKFLQEFERREQYSHADQPSVTVRNVNISRQQTELKLIQERSQSVTQSALMALVDKLTAEIAGDYSIPAHSAKE